LEWRGELLTPSGLTDRKRVNAAREKWCWIGGQVGDATCGIEILNHPGNFRFGVAAG